MKHLHTPFPTDLALVRDTGEALPVGQVAAANESRFDGGHFSQALTAYAAGYKDPTDLDTLLELVAPRVPTSRRFEYAVLSDDDFFAEEDDSDVRAVGSDFKLVKSSEKLNNGKTLNKGLTIAIDLDQTENPEAYMRQKTAKLLRRLKRTELIRAINMLDAVATNTAKTWDVTAGKDPDMDVTAELSAGQSATGIRNNRIIYASGAWDQRALAHRAQNSAGGFASATLTPEQLANLLRVQKIGVIDAVTFKSPNAKKAILNGKVIAFYAEDGMDEEDASHVKRFVSPCMGGGDYRVYQQQMSAKIVHITVEHYSVIINTLTKGIRKLTIS